jgi:tetratricopeptide (TPR) repeat protein
VSQRVLSLTDAPLVDARQFGFDGIVPKLRDFIASSSPDAPFNICLSGAWGAGKTSMLRTLEQIFRLERRPDGDGRGAQATEHVTLWFEPWKLADEGEVRNALARKVLDLIAQDGGFIEGARIDVDRRSVLRVLADRLLGVNMDELSRFYRVESATRDSFLEIEGLFRHVADVYLNKDPDRDKPRRRIVVFVDDLDRCRDARVVEVLEAVKLFFDLPGMVFVFALDHDQVERAVMSEYQFSCDDARVYLEKIFQLTVELPRKRSDHLVEFLEEQLDNVGLGFEGRELTSAVTDRFGHNLRSLKRFINGFSWKWSLVDDPQVTPDPQRLFKWFYLEHTMPNGLTAAIEHNATDLVVALEFLAYGGFLHDREQFQTYVARLRRSNRNYCALVVAAIVGDDMPEGMKAKLTAEQQALVEALRRDGGLASTTKVLREGEGRLIDADLSRMVFLTRASEAVEPDEQRRVARAQDEVLSLAWDSPLRAVEWNRLGDDLRTKGDKVKTYLCYLMALLMEPQSATFLIDVGRAMRLTDRVEAAKALMRRSYELDPASTYLYAEMAALYDIELEDTTTGSLLYRKAIEIGPVTAAVPFYLSLNLDRDGRTGEAFLACVHACVLDGAEPRMRDRLLDLARKASVTLPEDLSDAHLRQLLNASATEGKYPLLLDEQEEQTLDRLFASHPTLAEVADELSHPPL